MNAAAHESPPSPRTCARCGLPAAGARRSAQGAAPESAAEAFCCTGCALAWYLGGSLEEGGPDRLLGRILISAFLAMGVMVFSLALYSEHLHGADPEAFSGEAAAALRGIYRMAALALSAVVVHLVGLPLLESVVRTRRWLSADALILVGAGAAFALSVWKTFAGDGEVYFETATMVLVLVGLGRWLDARAKERARSTLRGLAEEHVGPVNVLVGAEGREHSVPPEAVRVGDRLRVRPGEVVPVDGLVLAGRAFVDASSLTGEAEPRAAAPGDRVLAGTVPLDGALELRAEAVGDARVRAEIERLLRHALESAGRQLRLADRAARVLLPTAIAIAIAAGAVHWIHAGPERALMVALSVLLISCPCSLGIATPLAFWSALGAAWRRGVLVKGADVLERLARARRVWFDKTGTLTDGEIELAGVEPRPGWTREQALALAGALEISSEHPIGRALRRAASEALGALPEPAQDFRVRSGLGVEGRVDGALCTLERAPALADAESAAVRLVREGEFVALFRLTSRLRPEAAAVVAELARRGLEPRMLTGDARGPATALGRELGLEVEAELLPGDKVRRIEELGRVGTVFVGDGLNDAAALASADVGIALGSGSPRSLDAADVNLLRGGAAGILAELPALLDLARSAVRTARANLAWAFAYNAFGLPLAASGKLTPIFAASAMVVSSLVVVLSSSRLLRAAHGGEDPAPEPEPPRGRGGVYALRPTALTRP